MNSELLEKGVRLAPAQECVKYDKYLYLLPKAIDDQLIESLACLGQISRQCFSSYSPLAKDIFEIQNTENPLKIQGSSGSESLYIVVRKKDALSIDLLDKIVAQWL